MTKLDATDAGHNDAQRIDEAIAYTRNVLAQADSVDDTDFADAAHDERGRSDLYRILNSQERPTARRRYRRRTVVVAAALVLAGIGAAADATGIVPTGVIKSLRAGGDGNLRPYAEKARLRAETRTADGDVVQLWEAPNNSGGICSYIRVVPSHGKEEKGGGVTCAMPDSTPDDEKTAWDRVARISWETFSSDQDVAHGHIDPRLKSVTLRVTLTDGRQLSIPVNRAGYFLGILPDVGIRTVAALDAKGRVLVTYHEIP